MEYVAFAFGIFGLMAFLQIGELKNRIKKLEAQLSKMEGTPLYEARQDLLQIVRSSIGSKVTLDLKEDYGDVDIMMYGNSKHGANTILDADEDWVLVRVDTPKKSIEKLIRLEGIERIGKVTE